MTQEHVMPRWLAKLFADPHVAVDFESTMHLPGEDPVVRPWTARPFDTKVGGPCASCNNGWMSRLETDVAPTLGKLVAGEPAKLGPLEQHLLATWATKTMLMLRLVRPPGDEELAPDFYSWLAERGSPPPSEHVWLGYYAGEGQWPMTFHYFGIALARPGIEPGAANAHSASFAIGHAAFALAGHAMAVDAAADSQAGRQTLSPIWPATAHVDFPPPRSLRTDDDMRAIAIPPQWRDR